ncbi:protein lin-28 homolog B isoform X1 [Manis pentadactyla]|uniref:protein lin-28 homolog B isoform X1 n=1 Tax=Manis pentadactyla TaxID=143292 RepID=UPI00255C2AB9|nr:protein lin-28 homolog B isoform X1 [Manis pentadactyla]
MRPFNQVSSAPGGAGKGGEEPGKLPEQAEEESQVLHGTGHCKWFNVRMGFGFISMVNREGSPLDIPVDVFVHQSKLFMEGFRSLKEGEPVEFTFKKSSKGLESIRVTGPGGTPCLGSERRPKGKTLQKRKPKGDRCYNCGGLDHHAKECSLPPQPRKCHCCQSIAHMLAACPHRAAPPPAREVGRASPPGPRDAPGRSPPDAPPSRPAAAPDEQGKKGPSVQKRKKT